MYPESLRAEIDAVNDWVYPMINDGVYKCGFAKSQSAYDEAVTELYSGLERVEEILSKSRFLVGNTITEADVRLFMTLVRFDEVTHSLYKRYLYPLVLLQANHKLRVCGACVVYVVL